MGRIVNPNLYVAEDAVYLIADTVRLKFSNSIWDAMVKYVVDYRDGKASDDVVITDQELPEFKWEDPGL